MRKDPTSCSLPEIDSISTSDLWSERRGGCGRGVDNWGLRIK